MYKLILNFLLLLFAIIMFSIILIPSLIYSFMYSIIDKRSNITKFWSSLFLSIALGIDKLGGVILAPIINIIWLINYKEYPFGNINHTISHVLAINSSNNNTTKFGNLIIYILEILDPGHMDKSI